MEHTGPGFKRRCRMRRIAARVGVSQHTRGEDMEIVSMHIIITLNPQPLTDLLNDSNLAWAKCFGHITVDRRCLS